MRALTTGEVGSGTRTGGRPRRAGSSASTLALAARPRSATPVFVGDGRRGRWLRGAGQVVGVAMAAWITLSGLALVGSDRAEGLRVAADRAIALDPDPTGRSAGEPDPIDDSRPHRALLVTRDLADRDDGAPGTPPGPTPATDDDADADERSPSTLIDLITPPRHEPGRGAPATPGR